MSICLWASGDTLEPAVRYIYVLLHGRRGIPWSQLSGLDVLREGEGEVEDECEEEGTGTHA